MNGWVSLPSCDEAVAPMIAKGIATGQHRGEYTGCFTTVLFHYPDALWSKMNIAGFHDAQLYAVEESVVCDGFNPSIHDGGQLSGFLALHKTLRGGFFGLGCESSYDRLRNLARLIFHKDV